MPALQIISLFILFFFPGYLIIGKRFTDEEKFALSFGVSMFLYAAVSVILHLFNISIVWCLVIFPLSFLALFNKNQTFNISKKLILIFALTLLIGTASQSVSKFPTIIDSYIHFSHAESYLGQNWATLPFPDNYWQRINKAFYVQSRPPLFNLTTGIAFSIFGTSFEIAKLVVVLFNSFLVFPVYLIAKKLYDEKCAIYSTVLLITINFSIISLSFEVFIYSSAAYFALCLFYLYLKKERPWNWLAVFAGACYLTHPSSLILILSLILIEIVKNRQTIFNSIKNSDIQINTKPLYPVFIFILIISPWLIRNYMTFGDPIYTGGKYMPLMRTMLDYFTLNPPTFKNYFEFILDPTNFFRTKTGSIFLTFFPSPYSITFSIWDLQALWDPVKLKFSLVGFLTYPLLLVTLYFLIKKTKELIPMLFFLGLILALLLVGFKFGYMNSFLFPQSILLGIFGINIIKKSKIFIYLISIILLLQSIVCIYDRAKLKDSPNQELYSWIKDNIQKDEKIMTLPIPAISYFTGRGGFITPKEDMATILDCIDEWKVDYFIVGKRDLVLRDINIKTVEKRYKLLKEIKNNKIYKIR